MNKFRFVIVVWGRDYTIPFLEFCVPSLLFPGNLPFFASNTNSSFHIYTTKKYAKLVKRSNAYERLSKIMPVEFSIFSGVSQVGKYKVMTQCHAHFIQQFSGEESAYIFLSPDVVWADGAFARILEIFNSGKKAIVGCFCRLNKETFLPQIFERFRNNGILQPINPREMVKMAMDNLHPETHELFWKKDNTLRNTFPSLMFWRVGNEGILMRHFYITPILVKPINRNLCPDAALDADYFLKTGILASDIYVVEDSDDICLLDFTAVSHRRQAVTSTKMGVSDVTLWAKRNTHKFHRMFVKHKIRFHCEDFSGDWEEIEQKSDGVVNSILSILDKSSDVGGLEHGDDCEYIAPGSVNPEIVYTKKRFLSPIFLFSKFRQYGYKEFVKKIHSSLIIGFFEKVFGGKIKIKPPIR